MLGDKLMTNKLVSTYLLSSEEMLNFFKFVDFWNLAKSNLTVRCLGVLNFHFHLAQANDKFILVIMKILCYSTLIFISQVTIHLTLLAEYTEIFQDM